MRLLICSIFLCFSLAASAQAVQQFTEQALFVNGTHGYACYRIPAIIKAPNGDLLAFAEGRVHGCNDFGDVDVLMRRSVDNGQHWGGVERIADNGKLQAGNPAPLVDELDPRFENGRLFLLYNTGNNHEGEVRKGNGLREVWMITSTDNGHIWSSPQNITTSVHRPQQPNQNPAYNFSEDWRSYANTPGHAIQLKKAPHRGRLFVPANHSAGDPKGGFNEYRAHAFFSDDHGATWQLSESVATPSSNESIAVELSDGRVMQNIRHQNGARRRRLVATSSDGGQHWDSLYFDEQLISPVCQASIIDYLAPNGHRVLLFSNPANEKERKNMTVRISYDDGQNWLISRVVREGEAAYSDLVVQADEQIGLLYEHGNDNGIHYARFNYAWLTNGKNHTDSPYVKKMVGMKNSYAQASQFQLAAPKLDADQVFFTDQNEIRLQLDYEGVRIHYTLDGSMPTEQSPIYSTAIQLSESTTLSARAFHDHCLPSEVVSAQFFKLGKALKVKEISIAQQASEKYPGKGAEGLVDRKKGSTNFREAAWMGFAGGDIEVTIELQQKSKLRKVTASMIADPNSWIFLPASMTVAISKNGKDFEEIGSQQFDAPTEKMKSGLQFLSCTFNTQQTCFIKIKLKGLPAIPDWHPGKGTPAWMFIDELLME